VLGSVLASYLLTVKRQFIVALSLSGKRFYTKRKVTERSLVYSAWPWRLPLSVDGPMQDASDLSSSCWLLTTDPVLLRTVT
jgi:hypothetical protein